MTLSRQNIICGMTVIAFGLLLLSQTMTQTESSGGGMQAMDYPRVLLYLLLLLGGCVIFFPAPVSHSETGIPLFSARTCSLALGLVLYAALLDVAGFAVSSFCMACATGYIMGWRRIPQLMLFNACGIALIWLAFRYVLKIPLPAGYLL